MLPIFIGVIVFLAAILALYLGEGLFSRIVDLLDYLFGGLYDFIEYYYRALYNFIIDNPWKLVIAAIIAVIATIWIVKRQSTVNSNDPRSQVSNVNRKRMAIILALLIGWLGAHRFYLRQVGYGVLYLILSLIFAPLVVLIGIFDAIRFAFMSDTEFNIKYPSAS